MIAGSPRSGTTIVQEVFETLPGYKSINEPLLHREIRAAHGFATRSYIPEWGEAPRQHRYLEAVLQGRPGRTVRWSSRSESRWDQIVDHARTRRLMVKFCRINRMLPWFCRNFETRGVVFVVRHPCSVVSSMLKFGQWDRVFPDRLNDPDSPLALEGLPAGTRDVFAPIVSSIATKEEALAAIWALDHYIPLFEASQHPWILLSYERLLADSRRELDRINSGLGLRTSEAMLDRLARPSSSAIQPQLSGRGEQLAKWRRDLSRDQIDRILGVVERAQLGHLYSEAAEPDYAALNRFQDPAVRWA